MTKKNSFITIVDDDPNIVHLLGDAMEAIGFSTHRYTCPLKALESLSSALSQIKMIITDYQMPHLSGIEFIKELRKKAIGPPILMVTSEIDPHLQSKIQTVGGNGLIQKPFKVECVQNKTIELIQNSSVIK